MTIPNGILWNIFLKGLSVAAVGFIMISATPAFAQIAFDGLAAQTAMNTMNRSVRDNMSGDGDDDGNFTAPSTPSRQLFSRPVEPRAMQFSSSPQRRAQNLRNFVEKTRANNPQSADEMAALFSSTDIIGQLEAVMARVGLSGNNVSHAYSVYWISAWQAANGQTDIKSSQVYRAVADQAARGLFASPEFRSSSDAGKQELAEALLLQAAVIDAAVEKASGDRKQLKAIAKAVLQGAENTGLDLDGMTLTESGFMEGGMRRTGSNLSEAIDKESAVASAPTSPGEEADNSLSYALIAAAGGAGLAGVFLFGKALGKKG